MVVKRGRPRKYPLPSLDTLLPVKRPRGRPRKIISPATEPTLTSDSSSDHQTVILPHQSPKTFDAIWDNALALASTIPDHYSMRRNEQKLALQYALILNRGANLVELGVTHGRTAAILCYAAKLKGFNYYGIDNFTLEGKPEVTRANLKNLGLPFHLIVGNTHQIPWDKPIDYLLIDAGHDVVNITQDCLRWLPFVTPGGIVLFHDYNSSIDAADPHWGVKNSAETYCGSWDTLDSISWLLVKRKPFT